MKYDLNDLYYFVKVVEFGGFSQAAETLGIAKSKLSRRIADLEERLKVSLIYRSTRQFHVTKIGQTFYQQCKNVVEQAEIAQEHKGTLTAQLNCPAQLHYYKFIFKIFWWILWQNILILIYKF